MYIDTSGVRYTKPIDGLNNLPKLEKINLLIGPEATMYTNSKAIRIGDRVDENGNVVIIDTHVDNKGGDEHIEHI